MRSEQEMMKLILSFAEQDENIRAVVLNGSRANSNIPKDILQDFDIAYYVKKMAPLVRNQDLVRYFGELIILQLPDDMGDAYPPSEGSYSYLMQFMDGNRIDLSIHDIHRLEESMTNDSLSVVLLDKDGRVFNPPPASDLDYRPQAPSQKMFDDCCNEFWWLNPYVAKALWRGELISANNFLHCYLRGELMKMLEWTFGIRTGFTRSMGKHGKFLKEVLEDPEWQMLEQTYADADLDRIWQALFEMGELFRQAAKDVAEYAGFSYPTDDDRRVTEFLVNIQNLPSDATSF